MSKGLITGAETEEPIKALDVRVMPNPSNSSFNLSVKSNNKDGLVMLQVVDMFGRVKEIRYLLPGENLNIGKEYAPGTYILRVMQGNETKQLKILKLPG
jgi:hypothetical protein